MEPGELEVLGRGVDQGVERHESDDFALLDVDAFFRRERPDRFERLDERRLVIINHVHGHLYEPAIREFESFRPYGRQSAVALPNGLGDSLRDARDGDKGEDVESSHPWMFALVTIHVDPLHGLLRTSERGLGDTSAIANERDYGAIVVRVHLLIKDSDPGDGADGLRDCVDDILAAALGEIGDALDDLRHGGPTEATNVRVH